MAKYYQFHYDAGYIGTEVDEVFKYDDDVSEVTVNRDFMRWYENQSSGDFFEITEEEAKELGIDKDCTFIKDEGKVK